MAKRKESKAGPPLWYEQGKAAQRQFENSPELGIANHLAAYAEGNGLSGRMLKRYVALASFVDEHFPGHINKFTDQTPYSSIEELLKLHKINPAKAAVIAESVIKGEMIAAHVKQLIGSESSGAGKRPLDNTRSEARKAAFKLEEVVVNLIHQTPHNFGLSGAWEAIDVSAFSIRPDLAFKTKNGKKVAVEIRYISKNSSAAFIYQALTKYAWLQMNFFDEVYLAVNQDAVDQISEYKNYFKDWTGKPLSIRPVQMG